eukprot:7045128-Pyramimonas_sp.AAC.1
MFDRKASRRFDCVPPKVLQIPEGTHVQSYPDDATKMVCKLYTAEPGQNGRFVREFRRGEVVGPTVGPAERCITGCGDFVWVSVVDTVTEGSPAVWMKAWGPSMHSPPRGQDLGGGGQPEPITFYLSPSRPGPGAWLSLGTRALLIFKHGSRAQGLDRVLAKAESNASQQTPRPKRLARATQSLQVRSRRGPQLP